MCTRSRDRVGRSSATTREVPTVSRVRIQDTFTVNRLPQDVFAFMADPENLKRWQTVKTYVTPLTDGPTHLGSRFREGTKVGPRQWDQVVEVTEFEPDRVFGVTVTEGPTSTGRWTLEPNGGGGTRVRFVGDLTAPGLVAPIVRRVVDRQFRGYHENLRRELE